MPQSAIFLSKVKFVELFLLVFPGFFFLPENYFRSWVFTAFSAFSVRAQRLNQSPAMTYDMGNRDFVIKRYKVNTSAAVDIFFVALLFFRGLNIHDKHESKYCFYMGSSRMSSPHHTS